jgi:hypothetical protein
VSFVLKIESTAECLAFTRFLFRRNGSKLFDADVFVFDPHRCASVQLKGDDAVL